MLTIKDQHEKLAVDTAERIKKYLSKSWTEDGQDADDVAQISNKISSSIMDWLLALHGPTAIATKAATAAKKAIKTHCYEDEGEVLADMYNEAINTINGLHNKASDAEKEEKARLHAEREAKKVADKAKKEEDKKRKNELAAAKKLEASQDWDAIIAWRPEGRAQVSLRTMQANLLTGDARRYYLHYPDIDEAYKVVDISSRSLYLLSHYDSVGTPMYWEMSIAQFDDVTGIVTNKGGAQTTYRFYVG